MLKEIYTQDGKTPNNLKARDLIIEIRVPIPQGRNGSAYKKLRLGGIDFPLVGAAVKVTMEGDCCENAKIVLGAVGSGPIEVEEAEKLLKGKPISEEIIEEVEALAQKAAKPMANTATLPGYRRRMAGIFTKNVLREALSRAKVNQ